MSTHLVGDVLDSQLLDRAGRPMGMADGLVLELREGRAPRIVHIEVGGEVAWARVHPRLGRWAAAFARLWRNDPEPLRIPWAKVRDVGVDVRVDMDARRTPAFALEHWLRRHVIDHIPGSR
jgi:hypothetical protein